ncbi:hypothetical protein EB796_010837 [Bugula neritina]|uniref:TTC28 n=1 Tax=Bugula neritina TaxID=10212 RepID=A0A7J7JWQ4_BUGNE|nr:hypothetical protein EB796_010837 [Bugula neritina]
MRQAVHGSNAVHASIAGGYTNVGNVYSDMGEYSKALEYYRKCLKMQLTVYGSDAQHAHIAGSYNNIGNRYSDMGEYIKALEYYRKCLEMRQAVYGSDAVHPHIATNPHLLIVYNYSINSL